MSDSANVEKTKEAKLAKEKKPVVEAKTVSGEVRALLDLNRECKILEAEREFLQGELELFFEPDEDDTRTNATYVGDATPDSTIHVVRKRYTEVSISSSPSEELVAFLTSENALDLVNIQDPYDSLVVRRSRTSGAELKEEGIERAKTVLPKGPEASARRYRILGKELTAREERIEGLKEKIRKDPEFSELETSTYKFPDGETLSMTKNAGGKKTVSQSALVERFGEEIVERFGTEREKTLFKVETAAERAAQRNMFEKILDRRRLAAGREAKTARENGDVEI